jgi:hypothetical protein
MIRRVSALSPRQSRSWPWRGTLFAVVAVAIVALALASSALRRANRRRSPQETLSVERSWLRHTLARDFVVFDEDPVRAPLLFKRDSYRRLVSDQPSASYVINGLTDWLTSLGYDGPEFGVVFCHELTSKGGNRRLVLVGNPVDTTFKVMVVEVPRNGAPARLLAQNGTAGWHSYRVFEPRPGAPLRIFAGQPDADDPSGFVIPYEMGSSPGRIKGVLTDADRVTLRAEGAGAYEPKDYEFLESSEPH